MGHPVYRNRAHSFHLFAELLTVSSPPENNKFPAMWPVKIEYACTGCSDSSADKATPRPVDSVMEIPSARRLITTRPVVPGQFPLPVVESCSKSIAKSRYIASTVITRKIVFTGLWPDNIETFWLLAIHEPPFCVSRFSLPSFLWGCNSRFDLAIRYIVWNGLARVESKAHDWARFENITLWLRSCVKIFNFSRIRIYSGAN